MRKIEVLQHNQWLITIMNADERKGYYYLCEYKNHAVMKRTSKGTVKFCPKSVLFYEGKFSLQDVCLMLDKIDSK